MTLVLALAGKDTIWLMTDRRLSYARLRPKDDAHKTLRLECHDGDALLGYAGLGATPLGSQLSTWMAAVLRNENRSLVQSLNLLAEASKAELPKFLRMFPRHYVQEHHLVAPAFIDGKPEMFHIAVSGRGKLLYTRYRLPHGQVAPIKILGSGAQYIADIPNIMRDLLRLMRAHEERRITSLAVATELAKLNWHAHENEVTVGPNCLVQWLHRDRDDWERDRGTWFQFFDGPNLDRGGGMPPNLARGMDLRIIADSIMPQFLAASEAYFEGRDPPPEISPDAMNEYMRKHHVTDSKLR
jgi:hypothetical protein